MSDLIYRIQSRLEATKQNATSASEAAGLGKDFIRDVLRGKKKSISTDSATKLAVALQCPVSWLFEGEGADSIDSSATESVGIKYGGKVEAGAFRLNQHLDQTSEGRHIPLSCDPRYPVADQYAFEVFGDSMTESRIFEGMWINALDIHAWERIHGEPGDKALVVVARSREGAPERELTVKKLRLFRDRAELQPDSTNKSHQTFVFPLPPREDSQAEAQIIAVVLSATWLIGS